MLYRLGIRLISYDRPGYGGSERHRDRTVADAASDVAAIADALGIERFSVVGRSGGGPHALACAALLGSRVARAAALCTLAPSDAEDLNWWEGMADSNRKAYQKAEVMLTADLARQAGQIRQDPGSLLRGLGPELAGQDRKVVEDIAIWRIIAENHAEALRDNASGWIDDVLAFRRPWGFRPSVITTTPVLLWHGGDDVFSPVGHTRWLAAQIDSSKLEVQSGAAHFTAVEILPRILIWAAVSTPSRRAEPTGVSSGR